MARGISIYEIVSTKILVLQLRDKTYDYKFTRAYSRDNVITGERRKEETDTSCYFV